MGFFLHPAFICGKELNERGSRIHPPSPNKLAFSFFQLFKQIGRIPCIFLLAARLRNCLRDGSPKTKRLLFRFICELPALLFFFFLLLLSVVSFFFVFFGSACLRLHPFLPLPHFVPFRFLPPTRSSAHISVAHSAAIQPKKERIQRRKCSVVALSFRFLRPSRQRILGDVWKRNIALQFYSFSNLRNGGDSYGPDLGDRLPGFGMNWFPKRS